MAAVDPIVYAQLCKFFPALTSKQATNLCFYSMGTSHQELSSLVGSSPSTIKKSLESAQKHFSAESLPELKMVFWAGFAFRQICAKFRLDYEQLITMLNIKTWGNLKSIFPELTECQMISSVLYSIGFTLYDIAEMVHRTTYDIEECIHLSMDLLGTKTKLLLRALVTSRFIINLS